MAALGARLLDTDPCFEHPSRSFLQDMASADRASQLKSNFLGAIGSVANVYPKPENITFQYGTAGFRTLQVIIVTLTRLGIDSFHRGSILHSVMFRVGILAVLRSKKLDGKAIGVMITASHNPEPVSPFLLCASSPSPDDAT